METLDGILRWLQQFAFLAVGLWAAVHWRRRGDERSRWLALTFTALGTTVLVGAVAERLGEVPSLVSDLSAVTLVLFPYLLLRFADSFEPVGRGVRRIVGAGVLLQLLTFPVLPEVEPGDPRPLVVQIFVLVLLATWGLSLPVVARRFWLAARAQPGVARNRMRLLSVATVALAIGLFLAVSPTEGASMGTSIAIQLLAVVSSWLFLTGFAPPSTLRTRWRMPEERRAQEAAVALMGATTPEQVASLLVPHIRSLVAARGVELYHGGQLRASAGEPHDAQAGEAIVVPLSDGSVRVVPDAYTPFFGREEYALLERLAVLADLALDRTQLLATEQQVRRELEVANGELESFLYTASHDLKSPLIALLSYVDVVSDEYGDRLDDTGRHYLDRMASNCRYMESLVGDLLELSRVGRVDAPPAHVDTNTVLEDVATEVRHQHPGVRIDLGHVPALFANDLRVRQLFQNLLENAASHGGPDVTITVETSRHTEDGALLLVRDDGVGVPAEYRERVFGVFERLDADRSSGTGIGLTIARKIAESLGGRIWLTDHEHGAEFAIELPSAALSDGAVAAATIPAPDTRSPLEVTP